MKIKIKNKELEIEIEYETRWWGSEYHWTENLRILPFLAIFFNKKFEIKKEEKGVHQVPK